MTNPFDWPGPDFLVFYVGLGLVVTLLTFLLRMFTETGTPPVVPMTDPYLLACLRAGTDGAIRVAVASLLDRGLLLVDDRGQFSAAEDRSGFARRPIEQAILAAATFPKPIAAYLNDADVRTAANSYDHRLTSLGVLAGPATRDRRSTIRIAALLVLIGTAVYKIDVALSRGHANIGYLILLALFFSVVQGVTGRSRRTVLGDTVLADLKLLLDGLRSRKSTLVAGGATQDLALTAALFGFAAIPESVMPAGRTIDPGAYVTSGGVGGGTGDGGGSSCGGSSCSGGCGGGCGGCGS